MAWVLILDKDIIETNDKKNVKLLGQDLIDIHLKVGGNIEEIEKYYLILKVTIFNPKDHFSFLIFFYHDLIVNICEIELHKVFSLI